MLFLNILLIFDSILYFTVHSVIQNGLRPEPEPKSGADFGQFMTSKPKFTSHTSPKQFLKSYCHGVQSLGAPTHSHLF